MPDTNSLQISFRIQRIETLQFALLQDEILQDKLAYEVNFGYGIDAASKLIRSTFRYELYSNAKSCLVIEIAVDFLIEPESFTNNFVREGLFYINKSFATHLAVISVGTARGILHEKTKETVFANLPIPTINVESQITSDILFSEQ